MSETTTTLTRLARIIPRSETHWRAIAARSHRILSRPGDEAAARTHVNLIYEIRTGLSRGSTRGIRFCPKCLERGQRYILLHMGDEDTCGACHWPKEKGRP